MTHMADVADRRVVTGAEYVRQITALESDRRARSAFQHLILKVAPPGGALFDFGAGTGLDTRFYVEHGFTVVAYDVDPDMCGFFAMYCHDFIDSGRVTLERGSYREFLERTNAAGARTFDLVTSNFAPLNLIGDLRELFAKFHALTGPNGKVLASVLSPYFIGDLKYGWWWRNSRRLWRDGSFSVPGAQGPIVRRRLADLAHQCAPYFALRHVFPGLPSRAGRHANGVPVSDDVRYAWLRLARCRYMFALFEKSAEAAADVPH
ncbi:MAG TPA: methyltransferase domain-containing protein [Steroidobacteraceae bacterium]